MHQTPPSGTSISPLIVPHRCSIQPLSTWKLTHSKSWIDLNLGQQSYCYELILGKFFMNENNPMGYSWYPMVFQVFSPTGKSWQHVIALILLLIFLPQDHWFTNLLAKKTNFWRLENARNCREKPMWLFHLNTLFQDFPMSKAENRF